MFDVWTVHNLWVGADGVVDLFGFGGEGNVGVVDLVLRSVIVLMHVVISVNITRCGLSNVVYIFMSFNYQEERGSYGIVFYEKLQLM